MHHYTLFLVLITQVLECIQGFIFSFFFPCKSLGFLLYTLCSILPVKYDCIFPFIFRHETYRTQYRAMFVMNCSVTKEEILKYKGPLNKKTKKVHKKIKQNSESVTGLEKQEEEEIYHPVKCTECSTEVAVLDKDEVFHFFNVLASHS